jgi:hypothetical protein
MSSLGIRFVLPYRGGNGIDIVNGIIEVSTNKTINMRNIVLVPIASQKAIQINTDSSINADAMQIQDLNPNIEGNLMYISAAQLISLFSYSNGQIDTQTNISTTSISNENIQTDPKFTNLTAGSLEVYDPNTDKTSLLIPSKLQTPKIKTTQNNANAPEISFDTYTNQETIVYATIDGAGVDFNVSPE